MKSPLFKDMGRLMLMSGLFAFLISCGDQNKKKEYENTEDIPVNREMIAELTSPPHVPTPVGKRLAKKLIVKMEIKEEEGEMTNGVLQYSRSIGQLKGII